MPKMQSQLGQLLLPAGETWQAWLGGRSHACQTLHQVLSVRSLAASATKEQTHIETIDATAKFDVVDTVGTSIVHVHTTYQTETKHVSLHKERHSQSSVQSQATRNSQNLGPKPCDGSKPR